MKCIKCGRNIRTSPDERSAFKNMGYYTPMYWVRDQGMDEKTCIDAGLDPNDSSHFLCFDCYYDLMDIQRAEYMKDYEGNGNVIKLSNKFKESEDTVYRKGGRVEDLIQIVDELQVGEEVYINAINISPAAIAMLKDMVSGGILEPKAIELERVVVPEALGDFYNGQSICPQMTYIKKRNIKSSPIREYKEMKVCPYCGEYIDSYEPICPVCDSVLDETALDESVKLQEGKKLKAAILAGLMAFTGLAKLNANSLKTTKDWDKSDRQIKKELIAEYGKNGDIPEKDLNKMWLAGCRYTKANDEEEKIFRWDDRVKGALAEMLEDYGFEDAAEELRHKNGSARRAIEKDVKVYDKGMAKEFVDSFEVDRAVNHDLGEDDPEDLDESVKLTEGKKLKAAILAGLMAFTGLSSLHAKSLKTTNDWDKSQKQIKKELIAEYGKDGDIPKEDLKKMWLACCRSLRQEYKGTGISVHRYDRNAQKDLVYTLEECGFEDAAESLSHMNGTFETDWEKYYDGKDLGDDVPEGPYNLYLGKDDPKDLDEDTEVSFDFSNNEDAKDFIDDTKEKYHYKTGTRKYEVDKGGTTPRGGKVYFKGAVRRS